MENLWVDSHINFFFFSEAFRILKTFYFQIFYIKLTRFI